MTKKSIFSKLLICTTVVFSLLSLNIAQAQTDDARVLGGIDLDTDIFTYLNTHPYTLWKADHSNAPINYFDSYMSKDKCVLITLGHDFLRNIFILGPGYKTDKGIEIGMTIDDIKRAYGPLYTYQTQPQDHTQTYGIYNDNRYSKKFFNYITIEYVSPKNEGLEFVIDKATGKIILIRYQSDRHGGSGVLNAAEFENVLPRKHVSHHTVL